MYPEQELRANTRRQKFSARAEIFRMNKKYCLAYLAVSIAVAGAAYWSLYSASHTTLLTTVTRQEQPTGATITLTAGSSTYTLPYAQDESVLEAMRSAASSGAFAFSGRDYPGLGFFVDSINGVRNANGVYWFLYVNGTSSETGASQTLLHAGDVAEWRYERNH